MTDLEAVRCAFASSELQPPLCVGNTIPAGITRRLATASQRIDQLGRAPTARQAQKLARSAYAAVKKARGLTVRAGRKHLSPDCTTALLHTEDNALVRIQHWLGR